MGTGRASHPAEQNIKRERSQPFRPHSPAPSTALCHRHFIFRNISCIPHSLFLFPLDPLFPLLLGSLLFSPLPFRSPKEAQKPLFVCRRLKFLFSKTLAATGASAPGVTPSPEGLSWLSAQGQCPPERILTVAAPLPVVAGGAVVVPVVSSAPGLSV